MSAHHRTKEWAATTRAVRPRIAASLPQPCIDCGRAVMPGERWQVGHRVSVAEARAQGWTVAMMNHASNLGPSHSKGNGQKACNQIAGGKLGATVTNAKRKSDDRKLSW